MAFANFHGFGTILKTEDQPDGTIKVFGVASSGSRDHADEVVTPEAMKAALPDYSRHPALREMHDGQKAAGRVLDAAVDDDGVTQIEAHVVDPIAVAKVKSGTYSGFSIGGKVTKRDKDDRSIITGLRLVEISLVDAPCNPDATLNMWKADMAEMTDYVVPADEVVTRAKEMAKADGRKAFRDYLYTARQELTAIAKAEIAELLVAAGNADEAELAAAAAVAPVEPATADPAATVVVEPEAADGAEKAAEAAAATDPAAALIDALAKAQVAVVGEPEATAPTVDLSAELGKRATVLRILCGKSEDDLAKGLYTVSRFADLLESLASVQRSTVREAEDERDNSEVPAMLAQDIANLSRTFLAMANEEIAEIMAAYAQAGMDIDFDPAADDDDGVITDLQLAAGVVDLVKADTDLMEKAGKRNSKADGANIQDIHDRSCALGATCTGENVPDAGATADADAADKAALIAENDRLAKALADAAPQIDGITKAFGDKLAKMTATIGDMTTTIDDLKKRLAVVEDHPAAPKTAAGGHRTVTKADDVSPSTGTAHNDSVGGTAGFTAEEFKKSLDSLPDAQKGEVLLRIALNNPTAIKL